MPINHGDDRRRLVPSVLVSVLTTLIDEVSEVPSHTRVELRSIRARLCRLYSLPDPQAPANATEVAWEVDTDASVPE